jgi:hypothetical protein
MNEPTIPEGWTKHDGGPCPVADDARVNVMFRDGYDPLEAGQGTAGVWGSLWQWQNHGPADIIAYKVVKP